MQPETGDRCWDLINGDWVWEWRETRTAARSQLKEQEGGRLENAEEISRVRRRMLKKSADWRMLKSQQRRRRGNKECTPTCPQTLQCDSEMQSLLFSFQQTGGNHCVAHFHFSRISTRKGQPLLLSVSQRGGREREKNGEELRQEVTPGLGDTSNSNSQMGILLLWILLELASSRVYMEINKEYT